VLCRAGCVTDVQATLNLRGMNFRSVSSPSLRNTLYILRQIQEKFEAESDWPRNTASPDTINSGKNQ
jgi:hypothetical protein